MRIIVAPDKFKGCLGASDVAAAAGEGIATARPEAAIDLCPLSDGGEGFVEALVGATGGTLLTRRVTGPLPDMKVEAVFGLLGDGRTAAIEMAAASGLHLLPTEERNPMRTTTFGVGELILAALDAGAEQILLGIGGSATNDGGLGCAQACGLPILLRDGEPVETTEPLVGADLERVMFIKHGRGSRVDRLPITVACDVTNPLLGARGAAHTYGPQKGATPEQIEDLDRWLHGLAMRTSTLDIAQTPGAGAAGGLGWGLMAFFNAQLEPGIEIVMRAVDLPRRLAGADICLTGEGRLDATSFQGKVVGAVLERCRAAQVRPVIIAGQIDPTAPLPPDVQAVSLTARAGSAAAAMADARSLIRQAAADLVR